MTTNPTEKIYSKNEVSNHLPVVVVAEAPKASTPRIANAASSEPSTSKQPVPYSTKVLHFAIAILTALTIFILARPNFQLGIYGIVGPLVAFLSVYVWLSICEKFRGRVGIVTEGPEIELPGGIKIKLPGFALVTEAAAVYFFTLVLVLGWAYLMKPAATIVQFSPIEQAKHEIVQRIRSLESDAKDLGRDGRGDVFLQNLADISSNTFATLEDAQHVQEQLDLVDAWLFYLRGNPRKALALLGEQMSTKALVLRVRCHYQLREFDEGFKYLSHFDSNTIEGLSILNHAHLIEALERGTINKEPITTASIETLLGNYDKLAQRLRGCTDLERRDMHVDCYSEKISLLGAAFSRVFDDSTITPEQVKLWSNDLTSSFEEQQSLMQRMADSNQPLTQDYQILQLSNYAGAAKQAHTACVQVMPEDLQLQNQWEKQVLNSDEKINSQLKPVLLSGGFTAKVKFVYTKFQTCGRAFALHELELANERAREIEKMLADPKLRLRIPENELRRMRMALASIYISTVVDDIETKSSFAASNCKKLSQWADDIYDNRQFEISFGSHLIASIGYMLVATVSDDPTAVSESKLRLEWFFRQKHNAMLPHQLRMILGEFKELLPEIDDSDMLAFLEKFKPKQVDDKAVANVFGGAP